MEEVVDHLQTAYLNSLGQHSTTSATITWIAEAMINGKVIPFKLDIGAEVLQSEEALQSIGKPIGKPSSNSVVQKASGCAGQLHC